MTGTGAVVGPRMAIYVDGTNFGMRLRDKNLVVDYGKFSFYLEAGRVSLFRGFYGSTRLQGTPDGQALLKHLRANGWHVVTMGTKKSGSRKKGGAKRREKGVDIALATDMVLGAAQNAYDVAVIVTHDADFWYAIDKVQSLGKVVELAVFERLAAKELKNTAAQVRDIEPDVGLYKI